MRLTIYILALLLLSSCTFTRNLNKAVNRIDSLSNLQLKERIIYDSTFVNRTTEQIITQQPTVIRKEIVSLDSLQVGQLQLLIDSLGNELLLLRDKNNQLIIRTRTQGAQVTETRTNYDSMRVDLERKLTKIQEEYTSKKDVKKSTQTKANLPWFVWILTALLCAMLLKQAFSI